MPTGPVPRLIPDDAVDAGIWRCVVCGETKPLGGGSGKFPTVSRPKGQAVPGWHSECRDCRDKRQINKGGDGRKPPWDPEYRGPLLGWDGMISTASVVESFPTLSLHEVAAAPPEEDEDDIGAMHNEGAVKFRHHRIRERDRNLRAAKVAEVRDRDGHLACEACDTRIEAVYATPDGAIYECHHLVPLHVTGETQTTLSDVVLLCPTCHRAAHRTTPWPSLQRMRSWHGPNQPKGPS